MSPIDSLNPKALALLRAALIEALQPFAEQHNLAIQLGRCRYDAEGTHATFDLEVAVIRDGQAQSREVADFHKLHATYGLEADDLGRQFQYGQHTLTLAGLAPGRSKFPIVARKPDGTTIFVTLAPTKQALMRTAGKSLPHCHVIRRWPGERDGEILPATFDDRTAAGQAADALDKSQAGMAVQPSFGIFDGCTCARKAKG